MAMEHGIISTIHTILGIGTTDGATDGAGALGIAGTEASGDGIILMLGHTGDGDQVGTLAFGLTQEVIT